MVRSQSSACWTIGQLAAAGGVGVETIRFYQRRGLLGTPPRTAGIRRYDGEALRRLRFIRQAQAAGFTLDEIAELLTLDAGADRQRVRDLARARIALLDCRLVEIRQARDALRQLARACESETEGPCPILAHFQGVTAICVDQPDGLNGRRPTLVIRASIRRSLILAT